MIWLSFFLKRYSLKLNFYKAFSKKPLELTLSFHFVLLVPLTKKLESIEANEFDV